MVMIRTEGRGGAAQDGSEPDQSRERESQREKEVELKSKQEGRALSRAASLRRKRGKKGLVGFGNRDLARLRIWGFLFWGSCFRFAFNL
uniref:Uncharacterized protein n=1 Tax=Cucumis melo TaxID=3656 RepID=A0A9I9CIL4_CUCME